MAIRRLASADCQKARDFLDANFKADPETGGTEAPTKDFLEDQLAAAPTWVAEEDGKMVGVLGPAFFGRHTVEGEIRTFVYFNRLVVDWTLYTASRSQARLIARDLTIAAADEIKASGAPDDIMVVGPKDSRGASWCRLLKMTEEVRGGESRFILQFDLIWERAQAAVLR